MITTLCREDIRYILKHLREQDRREFQATSFTDDIELAAAQLAVLPGPKWVAHTVSGTPAVMGGFVSVWPGTGTLWMWGTDDWNEVRVEVTKFVVQTILPRLDRDTHRVECRTIAGNNDVIHWLEFLGFRLEAVNAQFGRGREDFFLFARVPDARPSETPETGLPLRQTGRCEADGEQLRLAFL